MTRAYELMAIIDAGLDDEVIDQQIATLVDGITSRGGTVRTQDRWGRRRLAYEIDHRTEGYYIVLEFVGGSDLDQLERSLRLADEIVRHKLLRLPDREAARRGLLDGEATPATAG
jgi:small subunit ribosomal protein S6